MCARIVQMVQVNNMTRDEEIERVLIDFFFADVFDRGLSEYEHFRALDSEWYALDVEPGSSIARPTVEELRALTCDPVRMLQLAQRLVPTLIDVLNETCDDFEKEEQNA